MKKILLFSCSVCVSFLANAQDEQSLKSLEEKSQLTNERIKIAEAEAKALALEKQNLEQIKENEAAASDLDKFGFGLGFGVIGLQKPDVRNAVIDNGVVRITESEKEKLGFWLTASWIHDSWPTKQIGFGPFFGVQLGGNNEIVNSIAAGIDFSFERISPKLPLDFQVGYGITRVERLASGYIEDVAAPEGVTQPVTKKTTDGGWVMIFSYKL